jgi:hypothetical protein
MRKLLRTFLAVATFAVAWLVVSPARAWTNMAPICDPRGATTFAPPPQIQDAEQSLDVPEDCAETSPLETKSFSRGRGPEIQISFSSDVATQTSSVSSSLTFVSLAPRIIVRAEPLAHGVHTTLERPPKR